MRRAGLLACVCAALLSGAVAFDRISAESLRTNITWLAADQRQGRLTPSPGLDASADYIAAQFRGAGLSPGGDKGSFFQIAKFSQVTQNRADFRMSVESGVRKVPVTNVSVESLAVLDFQNEPVVRWPQRGRIVLADEAALEAVRATKPALILLAPEGERPKGDKPVLMDADPSLPPVIRIYSRAALDVLRGRDARLTLHAGAPIRRDVTVRNVAGVLRGSDASLRDQYVIVSAHYDHTGTRGPGQGDRIFNGANDNASGAASLIEIAKALAGDPPRRSVLFLALFGEEEGLLGSAYYVRHPLVPIARTVANINLEQLGRTDSSDGPQVGTFAFTGPSFSDLPRTVESAAKTAGIQVYRKDEADEYFDRSDNYSFARVGIVAHTIVVAFEFSDYHALGDSADKIDYGNLAKVDRGIAAGVAAVADASEGPKWSESRGARVYREASGR